MLAASLAAGLPLVALAAYRQASTGRFALTSEHSGSAILSSYAPGASASAYVSPYPFTASVRPDLLRDRKAFFAQAGRLAFQEALRRPGFHAARILSWVCTFAVAGESNSLYWSLGAPEALPAAVEERGAALAALARRPLLFELAAIQGLFLATVMVGIRRRNLAILALASAVLLKYAVHAVTAIQGRYFFVATALEILAILLAAYEIRRMPLPGGRRLAARALAAGLTFSVGLLLLAPRLAAFVQSRDIDQPRTWHFVLEPPDRGAALACAVNQGLLASLELPARDKPVFATLQGRMSRATLRTFQQDPAPGDIAAAVCELTGSGEPRPLLLQILDPYAPGGFPGRMLQRVEVDGAEVYSHDIAGEPGSGWTGIPLGNVGPETRKTVVIEVKAIKPDPGWGWGEAARTTFQLSRPD